jgi:hypothetical protein
MNKGAAVRFTLGLAAALLIVAGSARIVGAQESPIEQAKREQKTFKILGNADLYCSFFLLGRTRPEIKILAAEHGEEKVLLTDSDLCFINGGSKGGIAVGQLYLVVEAGPDVIDPVSKANLGAIGLRRGRARVVAVDEDRATVRLEKSCGQVMVGYYLVPFVERPTMVGQDEGYEPAPAEGEGASGRVLYIVDTLEEAGTTYWVLISLGTDHGLKIGQQLVAFRRVQGDVPRQPIASLVVIDVGPTTATLKVLSAKDIVQVGTEVQTKGAPAAK